jgi:hypothetical protein
MSNYTIGQPTLDRPWRFQSWDILESSTPPWQHRGFWYSNGDGDYVVVSWRWAFDKDGYKSICGSIHRETDLIKTLKLGKVLKESKPGGWGGGVLVFKKDRMLWSDGETFPLPLPDGRW